MKSLDEYFSRDILGSEGNKWGRLLRGINHNLVNVAMDSEDVVSEHVFITRPMLNMQASNLRKGDLTSTRKLSNLIVEGSNNIETYIRQMLDPRLIYNEPGVDCPLVDNNLAFIPLLGNTLREMSGLIDPVLDVYTSDAGMRGEQYVMADGVNYTLGSINLEFTFDKVKGNVVEKLLSTWTDYIAAQNLGKVQPYTKDFIRGYRNADFRVWRLNLDPTNTFLISIGCLNYGQFIAGNTGKKFDYQRDGVRDTGNTVSNRAVGAGATYDDPILILEFNRLSGAFNPEIRNMLSGREHNLFKLPLVIRDRYNFAGYPVINDTTMELEFWISKNSASYKEIIETYGE